LWKRNILIRNEEKGRMEKHLQLRGREERRDKKDKE
jgi:hypothetical protein